MVFSSKTTSIKKGFREKMALKLVFQERNFSESSAGHRGGGEGSMVGQGHSVLREQ